MAQFLASKKEQYVLIENPDVVDSLENWVENLLCAYKSNNLRPAIKPKTRNKLRQVLTNFAKNKKILIFDEGHATFSNATLQTALYKKNVQKTDPKILLFSATGVAYNNASALTGYHGTPDTIKGKYLWRPTRPNVKSVVKQLQHKGITMDTLAVSLIFDLCGDNFGTVQQAFKWIEEIQKPDDVWNYEKTLSVLRTSMQLGWGCTGSFLHSLSLCRAVKVPGVAIESIPADFIKILFEGPAKDLTISAKQELTSSGFILPIKNQSNTSGLKQLATTLHRTTDHFVLFDWSSTETEFGVSHTLMCDYYQDLLRRNYRACIRNNHKPSGTAQSCRNLVSRVVPFMSLKRVVSASHGRVDDVTVSQKGFPHEINFEDAICRQLAEFKYHRYRPVNITPDGTPDIIAASPEGQVTYASDGQIQSLYIIELVLVFADVAEHLQRFNPNKNNPKKNYLRSNAKKCLLIIGPQHKHVLQHVSKFSNNAFDVEIIGLVPSHAFSSYDMYYAHPDDKERVLSCRIPVDYVARSIDPATLEQLSCVMEHTAYVCVCVCTCMYVCEVFMHAYTLHNTYACRPSRIRKPNSSHKRSRENSKTFFPHTMISIVITSSILFNLYVDYEVEIGKPALKIEARNCEPTGNERHAEIIYPYPHT